MTLALVPDPDGIERAARISPCGTFRWWLRRRWEPERGLLGFVMLNPSTADASVDDPTIRRCMGYACREGYGGIFVANVYPFRATDPDELRAAREAGRDLGLPAAEQIDALRRTAVLPQVVCGWGAAKWAREDARRVVEYLRYYGASLYTLKLNADGSPQHPLYLRKDAPLTPLDRVGLPRA